jgi:hypothetical protein
LELGHKLWFSGVYQRRFRKHGGEFQKHIPPKKERKKPKRDMILIYIAGQLLHCND